MVETLILASSSLLRRQILERAQVPFKVFAPNVVEEQIKTKCQSQNLCALETASILANAKAQNVSKDWPTDLVLGADQILTCEGTSYNKPIGLDGVRTHLNRLAGKTHELVNAAVIVKNGKAIWSYQDTVTMVMRPLSDVFIEAYTNNVGEAACQTVGGYHLEGLGAQLFEQVNGDFFSILGLPLLPLLAFLRDHEMMLK